MLGDRSFATRPPPPNTLTVSYASWFFFFLELTSFWFGCLCILDQRPLTVEVIAPCLAGVCFIIFYVSSWHFHVVSALGLVVVVLVVVMAAALKRSSHERISVTESTRMCFSVHDVIGNVWNCVTTSPRLAVPGSLVERMR